MIKKTLAFTLSICLVLANLTVAFADVTESTETTETTETAATTETVEPTTETATEATTETTEEADDGEAKENSWRYYEGEPLISYSTMGTTRTPSDAVAVGIDVSHHQNDIDWEKVKANSNIKFVIIRCGYVKDHTKKTDRKWLRNVSECERLGIPYGVYLYSYATSERDVRLETEHVLNLLKGHYPEYPVYYDLEDDVLNKGKVIDYAKLFCSTIDNAGYDAGIYANLTWWNKYLNSSDLDKYDKWVAQWGAKCTYDKSYSIWQYTSSGAVSGISGRVDMNYSMVNRVSRYDAKKNEAGQFIDVHGNILTNRWVRFGGKNAYANESGYPATGFQTIDGRTYYFNSYGLAGSGWVTGSDGGKYYCINAKGQIAKSTIMTINNYRYGFDGSGRMIANRSVKVGDRLYIYKADGKSVLYTAKAKKKVTLRKGPGNKYGKAGTLKRDKAFVVVRKSGSWSQLDNGAWLMTKYRKNTVEFPKFVPYRVAATKKTYYRSGAGTKYRKKGSCKAGKQVTIKAVGGYGKWGKVSNKKWIYLPDTRRI